jgi:pimeloyl-ACP methyl ester carboxylesterase
LSRHFRIYVPDVLSQMGLSAAVRPLKNREDCAAWLTEVLDALNLDRVSMVGHSYGGWLTLNLALLAPPRIKQMVLLSPAASFAPIRMSFLLRFLSSVFIPTRGMIHGFMQSTTTMTLANDHPIIEQLMTGVRAFRGDKIGSPVVTVFSDDDLRKIKAPTLLLIGDQDASCKPEAVMTRARQLIPHIEAQLVANGGHLFPTDQAEITNDRMLAFLNRS